MLLVCFITIVPWLHINAIRSTQNGDDSLSAEDIIKMYEDKETPEEESSNETDIEQTQFPEKDIMLHLISTVENQEVEQENSDAVDIHLDNDNETIKNKMEKFKDMLEQKEKLLQEKEEVIMEKNIEITTFKDEIESSERENAKKSEEIEILIASKNSLEEEVSSLKVKTMEESSKVEKVNNTLKNIFKEKDLLEKENQSLRGNSDPKKQDKETAADVKKKLNEKQKEINDLKVKNKKLADDLAEEQAKVNKENPNSLILSNLLKTRTAEVKRMEKEKETNVNKLNESHSKLKEAHDKLTKAEIKNTRLETEVSNLIEILGKKDEGSTVNPSLERNEDRQIFQTDGNQDTVGNPGKEMERED